MQHPLAMALLVACVPIIVALCRAIGPGRAATYAILGVFLLMPRYNPDGKAFGIFTFDKLTVAGLSLALGVLLFDRRALAGARLHWVDAPMLLYIAAPLVSVLAGERSDIKGAFDQSWMTLAEWGVPYAIGRLYFADPDGPRRISIAIVVAGLVYIPFCFYEMALGGDWFLRPLIFGINDFQAAYRLGGWKPGVMLSSGLELVAWMALSTVVATWLWACRERWRARYLPAWLPPVALLITTVACRGVYGYIILALGLSSIALLLLTRTRWVLAPLLIVPLLYIGPRVSGAWDGRELVRFAGLAGDRAAGSVKHRLELFEDPFIRDSVAQDLAFGLGGRYESSWADGWWLTLLRRGGLLAVMAHYSAFLLPAALAIFRRSTRPPSASAEMGLALLLILQMIDSLHNTPLIAVATLAGGSLAGSFLGRSERAGAGRPAGAAAPPSAHMTYRLHDIAQGPPAASGVGVGVRVDADGRVAFVLATACLLYVFGHAPVAGQEGAKFVGGLGSALLFASTGAAAAGLGRRPLARVAAFAFAFGVLGVSFNLALHPTSRPIWSADILQGMALSGLVVASWRRLTGGGPLAFAGLAALAAAWWAIEPSSGPFRGSQYLIASGTDGLSLFPALPWLALSAVGAALVAVPPAFGSALAVGFGLSALMAWAQGRPFGPPVKFPLNPTYALLGASLASAAFALSGLVGRSKPTRAASDWLGRRWLVFFYAHLGIAVGLGRVGLTRPLACWAALTLLALAATWLVSEATGRVRPIFRRPTTWAVLAASTLAVGLVPGLPDLAVLAVAGTAGLLFAARLDELAALMLGPPLAEAEAEARPRPLDSGGLPRYLAAVAVVVAVLVAPELVGRLPAPFGTGPRSADARGPAESPGPRPSP